MRQHVKAVGALYIGLGVLRLFVALVAFLAILGGGLISGDPTAVRVTSIVAPLVAIFLVTLGLPGIVGGYGLLKGKSWARYLVMVLAVFNLFDFPIGTILSLYTYWVLFHQESSVLFGDDNGLKASMATG